ncbi:SprT-like domain-containing protein [Wenyingzhuangia sp. IMCC45574]
MIAELTQYIPLAAKDKLEALLETYPFHLKITRGRKTKRGDFRPSSPIPIITINNNLSKEQFLITLVHEIAHLHVYHQHKGVKPHGKEWKYCFQQLMLPFLHPTIFKDEILKPLAKHLINPKATTDSDPKLSLLLREKNTLIDSNKSFIFDLEPDSIFQLNNREFKILNKRRTRYLCLELKTKKKYLVSGNALVQKIN